MSPNWAIARRGELRLTERAIEFGDWIIPYEEIEDAVLLVGLLHMLKVRWRETWYQFGLKSLSIWRVVPDPFWSGDTPFRFRKEAAPIGWLLWFFVRLAILLLLFFFFLRYFKAAETRTNQPEWRRVAGLHSV
jgi:hypothetical protein